MIYIGIDIAKTNHVAAIMNAKGEIICEPFTVTNDFSGFSKLLQKIKKQKKENVVIGLESTSHYGYNLISSFNELNYKIAVINPIETASIRRKRLRNSKTDSIDAKIICKFLLTENYRFISENEIQMLDLKNLCRHRQNLKKQKSRLKIQLTGFTDIIFPEIQQFFKSGIHGKAVYALLKSHSSADEIAGLHLTYLSNLLINHSRGHYNGQTAKDLKTLAKSSVGLKNACLSLQITQTIESVELIEKQIDEVERRISEAMVKISSVITTVPGIGDINGAMILSEIGSISRFQKPEQVVAFAGLDPIVRQSGNFRASSTRMSKRGSSTLRFALINAAWNVSLKNETFGKYYALKISQGLRHYAALGHVAHKLIRVIFKLLKFNIAFDLP